MSTKLLGHLKSGEPVYERSRPHHNPIPDSVMELIKKGIPTIESKNRNILAKELKFDYYIGETQCVKTTAKDEIFYARKFGKSEWIRFVKNRQPEKSKCITIILLKPSDLKEYILLHRFIGEKGETNPSLDSKDFHVDIKNYIIAVDYWDQHAFIEGSKTIDPKTIDTTCPWWHVEKKP